MGHRSAALCVLMVFACTLGVPVNAAPDAGAWTESVLYRFTESGGDGAYPDGAVLVDRGGVLFGTTSLGGTSNDGTVFTLAPPLSGQGAWRETILYRFRGPDGDAASPRSALLADRRGDLYGTTTYGGPYCHGLTATCGTVFRLSRPVRGSAWPETVLHAFTNSNGGGAAPYAALIHGPAGSLYGTTSLLTSSSGGTVFALAPPSGGGTSWTEDVLLRFRSDIVTAGLPYPGLIMNATGSLFSARPVGGISTSECPLGCGIVFTLTLRGSTWKEEILHRFGGGGVGDGSMPVATLLADSSGALYGSSAQGGGTNCLNGLGCGVVFKLTPPTGAQAVWTETILYRFTGQDGDGYEPVAGLIADASGALYGTTYRGGIASCGGGEGCGTVFKLTPPGRGISAWTETVLHRFGGLARGDGERVVAGVTADAHGVLYGTTEIGGGGTGQDCSNGCGLVYRLTPPR